jgi:signal transduction histidine kinase
MSGAVELLESGRLGQLTPEQTRLLGMLGKGMQMMLSLIDDASTRAKAVQSAEGRGRAMA